LTVLFSLFVLLLIASILNRQLLILVSRPLSAIKTAFKPECRFAGAIIGSTLLSSTVLLLVTAFNLDEHKYLWETFRHTSPIGLVVIGFSLVVQSMLMGLYSCCGGGSSRLKGVEMEPLADMEVQQDEASFGFKA